VFDIVTQLYLTLFDNVCRLSADEASTDSPGTVDSTGLAAPGVNCTMLPWPFWSSLGNFLVQNAYMETFILVIENISWFSCGLFNSKLN